MNIMDLAKAIAPECRTEIVGVRPGEKLHEVMVPEDDAHHTLEYDDYFAILPTFDGWDSESYVVKHGGKKCGDGFRYSSETNTQWLSVDEIRAMAGLSEAISDE
jgi:UDP-N-acetylglucosamine 4,6-dehydratase